jgi:hypothetical protein
LLPFDLVRLPTLHKFNEFDACGLEHREYPTKQVGFVK